MFEDVKKSDDAVIAGDPNKVEDMFGKVDPTSDLKSAVANGKLNPVTPQAPQQPGGTMSPLQGVKIGPPNPLTNLSQVDQWSTKRTHRGLRVAVIAILALMVAGGVGAYVFFFMPAATTPESPENQNANATQNANTTEQPAVNQNTNQAPEIPSNALIDGDGDGLTDLEEQAAGTDPMAADTDQDGLNDRDELRVHKTNPLLADSDNDSLSDRDEIFTYATDPSNNDSDGDTYQDGVEIQNGYDPNGPGKLAPAPDQTMTNPPVTAQ